MKLTFICKTVESQGGNCPSAYLTDDGRVVIQGKTLDAAARAQLRDLGADEDAVIIPADVIAQLVEAGLVG